VQIDAHQVWVRFQSTLFQRKMNMTFSHKRFHFIELRQWTQSHFHYHVLIVLYCLLKAGKPFHTKPFWPLSDDAYSDLRYDPNWRTKLKGNSHFNESPQISVEKYYQVPEEISRGYRYSVDTSQAVMVTPQMAGSESDQPYYLHPQDGQTNSKTNTPKLTSHDVLSNKKLERPMEDIVERNKTTLGRSTSKRGSYVRVYSLKQQMPINVSEVHTECSFLNQQLDSSAPELMCLQKTQQLWVGPLLYSFHLVDTVIPNNTTKIK
uniref:Uncharacterized protein n=1 Tax=Seriola lalandi dorsalis TaxID=1841481 RepID=A0A3B4XIR7_SERLL